MSNTPIGGGGVSHRPIPSGGAGGTPTPLQTGKSPSGKAVVQLPAGAAQSGINSVPPDDPGYASKLNKDSENHRIDKWDKRKAVLVAEMNSKFASDQPVESKAVSPTKSSHDHMMKYEPGDDEAPSQSSSPSVPQAAARTDAAIKSDNVLAKMKAAKEAFSNNERALHKAGQATSKAIDPGAHSMRYDPDHADPPSQEAVAAGEKFLTAMNGKGVRQSNDEIFSMVDTLVEGRSREAIEKVGKQLLSASTQPPVLEAVASRIAKHYEFTNEGDNRKTEIPDLAKQLTKTPAQAALGMPVAIGLRLAINPAGAFKFTASTLEHRATRVKMAYENQHGDQWLTKATDAVNKSPDVAPADRPTLVTALTALADSEQPGAKRDSKG